MRVDWHGQSAFAFAGGAGTVFVDPWGDMSAAAARGLAWDYPAIAAPDGVDLLIVTHEHSDHNAVEVIGGDPALVRSTAGTHQTPLGDVVAIGRPTLGPRRSAVPFRHQGGIRNSWRGRVVPGD